MARLENWIIISRTDLDGVPYQKLYGAVYQHPRKNSETGELCDGHFVMTSRILHLDLDEGIAVTESGTIYELGTEYR